MISRSAADHGGQPDIVCVSPNHWSGLSTSKKHLMQVLARQGRVLFVEPPIDVFSTLGRRRRWPKLRGLRRAGDGPWVLPSVTWATSGTTAWKRRFHSDHVRAVVGASRRLELDRPVLWAFAPEHLEYVGGVGESLVVYQVADEPASLARDEQATRAADREMTDRADVVFAVSRELAERRRAPGKTHVLRNAADRTHYARVLAGDGAAGVDAFVAGLARSRRPGELRGARGPVVLFGGAAYDWFDTDLLTGVATLRPGCTFVLVGPKGDGLRRARLPSNVVSIGRRTYDEFPGFVASADATFMPVRRGETFETCDPIVVYEYLLCGKQVVATPFPAALEHGALVRTADGVEAFAEQIDEALGVALDEGEIRRRVEYGFANTWEDRAARAMSVIEEAVGGQEDG